MGWQAAGCEGRGGKAIRSGGAGQSRGAALDSADRSLPVLVERALELCRHWCGPHARYRPRAENLAHAARAVCDLRFDRVGPSDERDSVRDNESAERRAAEQQNRPHHALQRVCSGWFCRAYHLKH